MIASLLSLVILFCPAPDTSTPEAAAQAFGQEFLRLRYDNDYMKHDDLDPTRPLFTEEGWKRVEASRAKARKFDEQFTVLKWSFQVQQPKTNPDGSVTVTLLTTVRRNQGQDYKTKKIRVVEQRLPHEVTLVNEGGAWKVRSLRMACGICRAKGTCSACHGKGQLECNICKGGKTCTACKGAGQSASGRTCYSCKGNGLCRYCQGKGGRPCYSCKGAKRCTYCKGRGYTPQEWAKMNGGDPGPLTSTEDRASPTSAAQAYLDMRLTRWRTRSLRYQKRCAPYLHFLCAASKAQLEQALSTAKAAERLKEYKALATVEEVEVLGSTAHARLRIVSAYNKKARLTRLTLVQRDGKWLLERVETECYSCKGKKVCGRCHGTGSSRRCYCRTGKCPYCAGKGSRTSRSGASRTCFSCKGSGVCSRCKGTGKLPCYSCGGKGKCYSCKGRGWTQTSARSMF